MKKKLCRLTAGIVCAALIAGLSLPAHAMKIPTEQEIAAASLQAQGVMSGNTDEGLNLDSTLTRAELAVLLSRITFNQEHVAYEKDYYTRICTANFNDVPEWAQVHVGVCAANSLMSGYGDGRFGPSDPVAPAMACAVILRYLECDGWDYSTACQKALELGLVPAEALEGEAITRGNVAVLFYRALGYMAWLQTL